MSDLIPLFGPHILIFLGIFGLCTLVFWLLIFTAVKAALRTDREKATHEQHSECGYH